MSIIKDNLIKVYLLECVYTKTIKITTKDVKSLAAEEGESFFLSFWISFISQGYVLHLQKSQRKSSRDIGTVT